jgi:hypothetical protein
VDPRPWPAQKRCSARHRLAPPNIGLAYRQPRSPDYRPKSGAPKKSVKILQGGASLEPTAPKRRALNNGRSLGKSLRIHSTVSQSVSTGTEPTGFVPGPRVAVLYHRMNRRSSGHLALNSAPIDNQASPSFVSRAETSAK